MKKQLLIMGIVAILVSIGLSGCNQITDTGIEIKLINNCDKELHVTLNVIGAALNEEHKLLSIINKTDDVYIAAGAEKSIHFDNLRIDFTNQNGISVLWTLSSLSDLQHSTYTHLQTEYNATSPSILRHGVTLTFHQNGEVTEEG